MGKQDLNYNLTIKEHNVQAHTDIEHDMRKQRNGLFTFILRIDNGNIVDYNVVSLTNVRDYFTLKGIVITELIISHHPVNGSQQDSLRSDHSQRQPQGGNSTDRVSQYSQEQKKEI